MLLGKYLILYPFLGQLSVNMKNIFNSRCILNWPWCLFHDTSTVMDVEIKSKRTFWIVKQSLIYKRGRMQISLEFCVYVRTKWICKR